MDGHKSKVSPPCSDRQGQTGSILLPVAPPTVPTISDGGHSSQICRRGDRSVFRAKNAIGFQVLCFPVLPTARNVEIFNDGFKSLAASTKKEHVVGNPRRFAIPLERGSCSPPNSEDNCGMTDRSSVIGPFLVHYIQAHRTTGLTTAVADRRSSFLLEGKGVRIGEVTYVDPASIRIGKEVVTVARVTGRVRSRRTWWRCGEK